jgi:hypothetical protein
MPQTPPVRNATFSAAGKDPLFAAAAVRTLPRTARLMPMKPVRPDRKQPRMNAIVRAVPEPRYDRPSWVPVLYAVVDVRNTTIARGTRITAIVLN